MKLDRFEIDVEQVLNRGLSVSQIGELVVASALAARDGVAPSRRLVSAYTGRDRAISIDVEGILEQIQTRSDRRLKTRSRVRKYRAKVTRSVTQPVTRYIDTHNDSDSRLDDAKTANKLAEKQTKNHTKTVHKAARKPASTTLVPLFAPPTPQTADTAFRNPVGTEKCGAYSNVIVNNTVGVINRDDSKSTKIAPNYTSTSANSCWKEISETDFKIVLKNPEAINPEALKSRATVDAIFDRVWAEYPRRLGKKASRGHFRSTVTTPERFKHFCLALEAYQLYLKTNQTTKKFTQHGSTWFNNWGDWIPEKGQSQEEKKQEAFRIMREQAANNPTPEVPDHLNISKLVEQYCG